MTESSTASPHRTNVFQFTRRWLSPYWRLLLFSVFCSLILAIAGASYGVLMKFAGQWLREADERVLWMPAAAIIAAFIRGVSMYGHAVTSKMAVEHGLRDVQTRLFQHLNDGDYAFLRRESSAQSMARFLNDVNLLRGACASAASDLPRAVLTVAGCVGVMIWMDWALALFLLSVYPLTIVPALKIGNRVRKTSATAQKRTGILASLLSESFREARLIRAFNLQAYQRKRVEAGITERMLLDLKVLRQHSWISAFMEVAGGFAFGATVFFVGWRVLSGESTVEAFLGFIVVLTVVSPEIRVLGSMSSVVNEGLAAADRIEAVLAAKSRVSDTPGQTDPGRLKGAIEVRDISFSYGELPVLDTLSLSIKPGQTIALVGPSGAGKSTLFDVLLRLYDPDKGCVLFDGHDIRDLSLNTLRSNMALVSQEASLFNDTIAANIALGRDGASRHDIEEAARAAACDFIDQLPDGLETMVGEGGNNLSGGQRQRIAIARTFLRDASVLLLDEATSALDAENEARIHQALERLQAGRTTIVIAHRLSTVRSADHIVVMDQGRAVEQGSHDGLMEKQGIYAGLVGLQIR